MSSSITSLSLDEFLSWDGLESALAEAAAKKKWDEQNTYTIHLINILRQAPSTGMRVPDVYRAMRGRFQVAGKQSPRTFKEAIRHVFAYHCAGSAAFLNRDKQASEAIFNWPRGRFGGFWAVNQENARKWLEAKLADSKG